MEIKPFLLERYFAAYEFKAPYLLCCSDCESLSISELLAYEPGALDRFLELRLGYTESPGSPELRYAVAGLYQNLAANDILVHAGAEEAIFNFMNVTLQPGDHLIVHSPYYQSLGEVARSIGASVSEWHGNPDCGWELDLDRLAGLLTAKTRVVVLNTPHNPTGYLPTDAFLTGLSEMADRHGFIVFADEVYRGLEYNRANQLPAFADLNERAVSLGVMSKTYGLAGLRIGWLASRNNQLLRAVAAFKDYTTICNSAPSEFLATVALHHHHTLAARNLAIIGKNLGLLNTFFDRHQDLFYWQPPLAGPIAFPRYLGASIQHFCHELVSQAGVLLLPGTLYENGSNHFRIGFGRKNLQICLEKLEQFIKIHRDQLQVPSAAAE